MVNQLKKGQLLSDLWVVYELGLPLNQKQFPCLPENIDSLAPATGTFSRAFES